MKTFLYVLPLLAIALASCSKDTPCVICYEDEWSREPFPGQPKQHIAPLTPEQIKANGGRVPRAMAAEFMGTEASGGAGPAGW